MSAPAWRRCALRTGAVVLALAGVCPGQTSVTQPSRWGLSSKDPNLMTNRELRLRIMELEQQLRSEKAKNQKLQSQLDLAPAQSARRPTRPSPLRSQPPTGSPDLIAEYVSLLGRFGTIQDKQWKLCAVPAGAAKVTLQVPVDSESLSPFSLSETNPDSGKSDGKAYVLYTRTGGLGGQTTAVLGVGWVEDGALHWRWRRSARIAADDRPKLGRLDAAVHYASLCVFDANNRELPRCQFIKPAKIQLALRDPPVLPQQLGCPWEVRPIVAAIETGGGWVLKAGAGSGTVDVRNDSGLAFSLRLEPKGDRTIANCSWAPQSTPAAIQAKSSQCERTLRDLAGKISALENRTIPDAENELKNEEQRHQREKKNLEQRASRLPEEIREAEQAVGKQEEKLGLPAARQKLAESEAKLPRYTIQRSDPNFRELRDACDNARQEIRKREQNRELVTKKAELRDLQDEQRTGTAGRRRSDTRLTGAQQGLKTLQGDLASWKMDLANCRREKKQWEDRMRDAGTRQEIVLRLETEQSKILLGTVVVTINGGTERTKP